MNKETIIDLLDRPIAFHRIFVTITGGITAALMLSQAVYWSKRTKDPEGWFWKTQDEWEEETGMGRKEQETARARLRTTLFWKEERRGLPAKMYYRIDPEELQKALLGRAPAVSIAQVLEEQKTLLARHSSVAYARALKLGVTAEQVNYADVLLAKGMVCGICGKPIDRGIGLSPEHLTFDHIVPLSLGGTHTLANLQPAHAFCSSSKGGSNHQQVTDQIVDNQHTGLLTNNDLACCTTTFRSVDTQQSFYTETTTNITTNNIHSAAPQNEKPPPSQPQQQPFTMPGFGETSGSWLKYGRGYETRQRVQIANGSNVDAKTLTAITDLLIDAHGLRHAIDAGQDDRALTSTQEEAITLINMGIDTPEKIQTLIDTFKADRGYEIIFGHRVLIQYASQAKADAERGTSNNSKKGSTNGRNGNHVPGRQTKAQRELAERAKQYAHYDDLFNNDAPYVNPLAPLPELPGDGG